MKLVYSIVVLIAVALVLAVFIPQEKDVEKGRHTSITVANVTITAEVADTEGARRQGLSGREQLFQDQGMLFMFPVADFWGILMKDMKFPIDILWVDEKFAVVHIEQSVLPNTYPKVFRPSVKARYVLELPDGFASRHAIFKGNIVTF